MKGFYFFCLLLAGLFIFFTSDSAFSLSVDTAPITQKIPSDQVVSVQTCNSKNQSVPWFHNIYCCGVMRRQACLSNHIRIIRDLGMSYEETIEALDDHCPQTDTGIPSYSVLNCPVSPSTAPASQLIGDLDCVIRMMNASNDLLNDCSPYAR